MAAKRKDNFIVTMHHMIFVSASKEKGLISLLCNSQEVRVFNFYFSLRPRIFHERVMPLYCFPNFIKTPPVASCFVSEHGLHERKLNLLGSFQPFVFLVEGISYRLLALIEDLVLGYLNAVLPKI